MDCPPTPPACTESWSSVGLDLSISGDWPALLCTLTCSTGYALPPEACDVEGGSLWGVVTGDDVEDWLSWDWHPLAEGLYLPADGSGFVVHEITLGVHFGDWSYPAGETHAVTLVAAGVNVDGMAIALTCPAEVAPKGDLGFQLQGPQFGWPPDLDLSALIDIGDLVLLLEQWGLPWNVRDLLDLLLQWGQGSPWT